MSQKNETTVLVLALLITLGVVGGGFWLFKDNIIPSKNQINANSLPNNNQESIKDRISFGEKTLIAGEVTPVKKEGVEAIAAGSYEKAIAPLTASLKEKPNDPEALIFLNNARIGTAKSYTVAVPWHIDGNSSSSFPEKSRQLWGADVNWRTALSYDATQPFIAAL